METGAMNQDASSFFLPLTFTDFPPSSNGAIRQGEIIVLITSDNDDDVNEEFFMADACLYGYTVRPLQAVMRAAEAEYLTTHLPTEVDTIVAVVSYTDSLLGLSTPEQNKQMSKSGRDPHVSPTAPLRILALSYRSARTPVVPRVRDETCRRPTDGWSGGRPVDGHGQRRGRTDEA